VPGAAPLSTGPEVSGRTRAAVAARRLVIALSEDPQLLEALAGVPAGVAEVVLSPSPDRFVDQLVAHAGCVALIDASGIVDPIDFIASLRNQFPGLVLIIAGGGHLQAPLTPMLADGSVFRFVHKPASTQRLQLFIEAGTRQHEAAVEQEASQRLAALRAPLNPSRALTPVILGVVALTAGLMLWGVIAHYRRSGTAVSATAALPTVSPPPAAPLAPTVDTSTATPAFDPVLAQMLVNADAALAQNRLVGDDGRGAGDLYRTALQRAPGDAHALQGLNRVTTALLDQAGRDLAGDRADDAALRVDEVLRLQPDNVRAAALSVRLAQQREAALREQLRKTASGAKAEQAQVYVQLAHRRMESGALRSPADDNASTYVEAARALAPDDPRVRAVAAELAQRLAVAGAVQGTGTEPTAPVVPPAQSTPAEDTSAAAVSVDSAPVTAADPRASISAGELRRDHFAPPRYPAAALARGITGWVDLEFTVAADGRVKDAVVTAAQPRDTFDAAALAAVTQWHFAPVQRDGTAVEQHAHVRMRFSL
jgi:protein TonB